MPKATESGKPKKTQQRTKKPRKPQSERQSPQGQKSFQKLFKESQEQQRKHGKSENTSATMQTKKWLEDFMAQSGDAGQLFEESREVVDLLGDGDENEDDEDRDCNFATCLDGPPTQTTPLVITLFMYTKCFEQGKGDSTAWHIFAGWKYHYDQIEDRERGEWVGNPTTSPLVADMLAACKNKDGETEQRHSHVMTIEDMVTLYNWSCKLCPDSAAVMKMEEQALKTEHLYFRAFISVAFTLWTRNCEMSTLKAKDIDWVTDLRPNAPPTDPSAINIRLRERKGWQRKQNKGETQLNGHRYRIPSQPKIPAIDTKAHLEAWKGHYETHLLRRPLEPEDYIFPSILTNRKSDHIHFSTPVLADSTKKKVNEFAAAAGLPGAGRYTTHCFRRGGAQYRFMYAPVGERWTLAMVRWWGGWSPNERQDHSDALFPISLARRDSYLGESAEQAPLKTSEARTLFGDLKAWMSQTQTRTFSQVNAPTNHIPFSVYPSPYALYPPSQNLQMIVPNQYPIPPQSFDQFPSPSYWIQHPPSQSNFNTNHSPHIIDPYIPNNMSSTQPVRFSHYSSIPIGTTSYSSPITNSQNPISNAPFLLTIPKLPSGAKAFKQLVKDWDELDPQRGLPVALKDWKREWYTDRTVAQLYGQRRKVAIEFIEIYKRDELSFFAAYPEHKRGTKALHDAILERQKDEGRAKSQNSRYQSDND
ncbi:hypothetical protein K435DRAFT_823833 [Dendrothele bispora CBS 962.96]|uniref:Tyr recombinase domain-containing protein n=1 Tax=Dendrothele bispora (strain CBS 962.96) TaxID=1314807 RepID=A0A4S8KV39_DENBC|nr:hypothetical protein K435DRAFT_823833 [Dendrothele bispora CBS 962.96]